MIKKRVELLSPAGSYQALIGVVNAGADAVYIGGDKFSARAYAKNFTYEEILKALRYTHVNGKKLYLTLNTLVKEKEFSLIYDYVRPLYESGLDGIIVQDSGVWSYIREIFPDLPLHASTQMTITSAMGASLLKQVGASRIVPARELSLKEIRTIKEKTGLEIECFIHGAMCYCYSGQCLFSSILGGRSGNRGRCAQPCRLPYKLPSLNENSLSGELYPLSLKDMCTIEYIPKLIEAGIDSFKIEGRMKKPEYAAGVTAVYRKYIDKYYEDGEASCHVDKDDMDRLHGLYIRSEVQTGYYERYNGKEMITLGKGGYLGSNEALLEEIRNKYISEEQKVLVNISGKFLVGEAATLTIEGRGIIYTSNGGIVQQAQKRAMTKADILKQLNKTGNSNVSIAKENITVGENVFIPIVWLNELRRSAITGFENRVIESMGLSHTRIMKHNLQKSPENSLNSSTESGSKISEIYEKPIIYNKDKNLHDKAQKLHVSIRNIEQLQAVCEYSCDRIYMDSDLYISNVDQISQCLKNRKDFAIFLALPYIIREKDVAYLEKLECLINEQKADNALNNQTIRSIKGFLIRNLEELYWVSTLHTKYETVIDSSVYCFNVRAAQFINSYADEFYLPWELNGKECEQLIYRLKDSGIKISMPIYGTIPMMITANCVKKTAGSCNRTTSSEPVYLTDRYKSAFPVLCNCMHCYNIVYNSLPYSLHQEWEKIRRLNLAAFRLDFIFETKKQIAAILDFYTGQSSAFPITEYTAGHYKRGVE